LWGELIRGSFKNKIGKKVILDARIYRFKGLAISKCIGRICTTRQSTKNPVLMYAMEEWK